MSFFHRRGSDQMRAAVCVARKVQLPPAKKRRVASSRPPYSSARANGHLRPLVLAAASGCCAGKLAPTVANARWSGPHPHASSRQRSWTQQNLKGRPRRCGRGGASWAAKAGRRSRRQGASAPAPSASACATFSSCCAASAAGSWMEEHHCPPASARCRGASSTIGQQSTASESGE